MNKLYEMSLYRIGEIYGNRRITINATSMYRNVAVRVHCNDIVSLNVYSFLFFMFNKSITIEKKNI